MPPIDTKNQAGEPETLATEPKQPKINPPEKFSVVCRFWCLRSNTVGQTVPSRRQRKSENHRGEEEFLRASSCRFEAANSTYLYHYVLASLLVLTRWLIDD